MFRLLPRFLSAAWIFKSVQYLGYDVCQVISFLGEVTELPQLGYKFVISMEL